MRFYLNFLIFIFLISSNVLAFDSETIQICGGDQESLILCVGDLQNSPIGKSVYTAPTITPPQGGPGGISTFNTGQVCTEVSNFLTSGNITNESRKLLSLNIKKDTGIFVSESVLNHYIDNFKNVCNMTIDEPIEEVEQEKGQPFLLFFVLFLIIFIAIININKKIKKMVLAFFKGGEEEEDEDDLVDEDPDLIKYIKTN